MSDEKMNEGTDQPTNIDHLMSSASKMHENLESIQKQIAQTEFTGVSDDNVVSITLNGRHQVVSVSVSQQAKQAETVDLQAWITQAIGDAVTQVDKRSREQIMKMVNPFDAPADNQEAE